MRMLKINHGPWLVKTSGGEPADHDNSRIIVSPVVMIIFTKNNGNVNCILVF